MFRSLNKPIVLALIAAITTSGLGYLINQLPDIPNKENNKDWIVGAVVVLTLVVWIAATSQSQQFSSRKRTVVRGNVLRGKGNSLRISQQDVDVSQNKVIGDNQNIDVVTESESSGSSSRGPL